MRFWDQFDQVPAALWVLNSDGSCVYANEEFAQLTGVAASDAIDCGWCAGFENDVGDRLIARMDSMAATERVATVRRCEGVRLKGWLESGSVTIRRAEGDHESQHHFVLCFLPPPVRQANEPCADESGDRYRSLLNTAAEGIYSLDVLGRCTFINPAAVRMLGYEFADELLGRVMHDLVHHSKEDGSHYPVEDCAIYQAFRSRERVHVVDDPVWRKDGTSLPTEFWSHPIEEDGQVVGAVVSFIDITQRKLAQEALKEANLRKDEFLAVLAHELRNPLAPVRTGIELIGMLYDDPEQLESIRCRMQRQVELLVRLIDDLMDVSRVSRGKLKLVREPMFLRDAVRDAVTMVESAMKARDHRLTVNLPDERINIHADKDRLTQVFSNLLANAARYTPAGGNISIQVREEAGQAIVEVTDDGAGIDPAMQLRIFDMFSQVESGGMNGGLGIGLTLVKLLVEKHDGTVDVVSGGLSRGSTFTVRLPCHRAVERPTVVPDPADEPNAALRILVVDDNVEAAELASQLLEMLGHSTRLAHDGQQAVDAVPEYRPDLVLMDLGMPVLGGLDATREIRRLDNIDQPMIVALTGWGQPSDREKTSAAGCDDHVVKPIDMARLKELTANAQAQRTIA